MNAVVNLIFKYLDTQLNKVVDLLTQDIFKKGQILYMIKTTHIYIKAIAYVIMGVILTIELIKLFTQMEKIKPEQIIKYIIKLISLTLIVEYSTDFLILLYETGSSWINSIGSTGKITIFGLVMDPINQVNHAFNPTAIIGDVISILIPVAIIWILTGLVIVIAYGRMFELVILTAVAPIAIAFFPVENGQIFKKYILYYFAVVLQGLFIILCFKLFNTLFHQTILDYANDNKTYGDIFNSLLIGSLVLSISVFQTGSWAKKLMNV